MTEYIHLIGAEAVSHAGSSMQSAADDMKRAADVIDESFRQFKMFMDDWITRFEQIMKEREEENGKVSQETSSN